MDVVDVAVASSSTPLPGTSPKFVHAFGARSGWSSACPSRRPRRRRRRPGRAPTRRGGRRPCRATSPTARSGARPTAPPAARPTATSSATTTAIGCGSGATAGAALQSAERYRLRCCRVSNVRLGHAPPDGGCRARPSAPAPRLRRRTGPACRALGLPHQPGLRGRAEVRLRTRRQSALVPLTVADAGIAALDDGQAEVAVAFSSNPAVSRPDIVTLRDDRPMIYPDRVVPVVRSGLLRALRPARAREHPAPAQRGVGRALDARAARPQPGRDRRAPPGGRRRRVRRRQRPRGQRAAPAAARGSWSASRTSPRTRCSRTCMPRRCERAASA